MRKVFVIQKTMYEALQRQDQCTVVVLQSLVLKTKAVQFSGLFIGGFPGALFAVTILTDLCSG
jgi:hypothetical protein